MVVLGQTINGRTTNYAINLWKLNYQGVLKIRIYHDASKAKNIIINKHKIAVLNELAINPCRPFSYFPYRYLG